VHFINLGIDESFCCSNVKSNLLVFAQNKEEIPQFKGYIQLFDGTKTEKNLKKIQQIKKGQTD